MGTSRPLSACAVFRILPACRCVHLWIDSGQSYSTWKRSGGFFQIMRYFVDCEFNGFGGPLISLAAVPEAPDASIFYAATHCVDPQDWVAEQVLPVLGIAPQSIEAMAGAFADFLEDDPDPLLVADWPEDIAHAAQLLAQGTRRLREGPVRFALMEVSDFSTDVLSAVPHNAREDAKALRQFVLAREAWEKRAAG